MLLNNLTKCEDCFKDSVNYLENAFDDKRNVMIILEAQRHLLSFYFFKGDKENALGTADQMERLYQEEWPLNRESIDHFNARRTEMIANDPSLKAERDLSHLSLQLSSKLMEERERLSIKKERLNHYGDFCENMEAMCQSDPKTQSQSNYYRSRVEMLKKQLDAIAELEELVEKAKEQTEERISEDGDQEKIDK